MPVTITETFIVCHDCACLIANGECTVETAEGYADHADRLTESIPFGAVLDTEDEWIGSEPCRYCPTTDLGWRHHAALLA